jgi:enoyl-CoA hydratase
MNQAMAITKNIQHLPKELLVRTKKTLREAGGTNTHKEILDLETEQQLWSVNEQFAKNAIATMIEKISSRD